MESPDDFAMYGSPSSSQTSQPSPLDQTSSQSERVKAPACDFCRRLKIKCERAAPDAQCCQCASRNAECVRSIVLRKPKPKRKVHIEAMENRIRRMESVISAAISSSEKSKSQSPSVNMFENRAEKPDTRSIVLIGEKSFQFVGSSSGFSIFSSYGVRWIAKKTGNTDLERIVSQVARLDLTIWDQECWGRSINVTWHPLPSEHRHMLPDRSTALRYVDAYFLSVNSTCPIFHRDVFNEHFERQYSDTPRDDLSWYACFNVVLAVGSGVLQTGYPATDPLTSPEDVQLLPEELPAKYLRNATSVITDLQFGSPSLMSVQAILGMVLMLQGSANPLSTETLVAMATRISHAIGLNRWLGACGLSEQQIEERRNVFWMLYILDKGVSLHAGRPPVIHDQDIGVALPSTKAPVVLFPSGLPNFNTFAFGARLAVIESRVYSELYCPRARAKPPLQKLKSVGILDIEIQKWRDEVLPEIRPGNPIRCDEQQILPVLSLHYSYYNCLTTIHRASVHYGPWTDLPEEAEIVKHEAGLNPRVYESESICVRAARDVINLLDHFKQVPAPPMFWMSLSQPLCASLTLFANILEHPDDPCAHSDLELISSVTSLLGLLISQGRLQFATGTLWIFQELYQIANLYLAAPEARMRECDPMKLDTSTSSMAVAPDPVNFSATMPEMLPESTGFDFNIDSSLNDIWSSWHVDTMDHALPADFSFSPINID